MRGMGAQPPASRWHGVPHSRVPPCAAAGGSRPPTVLVMMGVSGCGKSTVGAALAVQLGCPFYEGDNFHPPENVAKMRAGVPLEDADRWPWLCELARILQQHLRQQSPAVLSCSALKPQYRRLLEGGEGVSSCAGMEGSSSGSRDLSTGCGGSGELDMQGRGSSGEADMQGTGSSGNTEVGGRGGSGGVDRGSRGGGCGASSSSMDENPAAASSSAPAGKSSSSGSPPLRGTVGFVLLEPPLAELQRRLAGRARRGGHFMPPSLLSSQLEALRYDPGELYCHFAGEPYPDSRQIVAGVLGALRRDGWPPGDANQRASPQRSGSSGG